MLKSSARSVIRLRGVRHNNLKNFDLDLPLNQLIVITGLSGSGKSSLAFDTLFAEGQRRYIETFSPYARQFFDRMDKPQVDNIEGIPPAVAIEQRNAVKSTRSTVGTMTEICDYMKLLWPNIARLHCRQCGEPVRKESPQQVWGEISNSDLRISNLEALITFDLPLSEKLSIEESLELVAKQGYQRLLLDGQSVRLDEVVSGASPLAPRTSRLTVVQDRLKPIASNRARFIEACEQAYHFGKGKLAIHEFRSENSKLETPMNREHARSGVRNSKFFSSRLHCARCDIEYREPTPALFSFNHPVGACPECKGFGRVISIDYDTALPDRSKTLAEGVVKPWQVGHGLESQRDLMRACRELGIPTNVPFEKLAKKWQKFVIEGDPDYGKDEEHEWPRAWYGVKGYFRWLESKAYKMHVRVLLSRYRAYTLCPKCQGARFQPEALLYRVPVAGRETLNLSQFYQLPVRDALQFVESLAAKHKPSPSDPLGLVLTEVRSRLGYLCEVGLGYLTLDRPTRSLSGGETERVNLTTCLGTRLVNTLFVLDEPSVGLHPRDTERLVRILQRLRDAGNTVVVVEHEAGVMRAADQIVDLGPGHGSTGGQVVFQGTHAEILKAEQSLTGQYLSGRKRMEKPELRPVKLGRAVRVPAVPYAASNEGEALALNDALPRRPNGATTAPALRIEHATRHNLKDVSVELPLQRFVCVTGVSGSGKTTLVREALLPALEARLRHQASKDPPSSDSGAAGEDPPSSDSGATSEVRVTGHEGLGRVVLVDQSILGKTPRSNPAVYIGAFDDIREVFAQSETAKRRGLNASAFSFNSAQGQCERCRGAGFEKIEMQFLSDVYIRCPDCNGRRYRSHILEVKIRGSRPAATERQRGGREEAPISIRNSDESRAGPQSAIRNKQSLVTSAATEFSIGDLLDATVEETIEFLSGFAELRPARRAVQSLKLLEEVGLGYLKLGQPINTLSGGESQRLKLVRHLAEFGASDSAPHPKAPGSGPDGNSGRTLFLFDEPTTGLHFDDVRVLVKVFQRLVDAGHSVLVIEHNLDVIRSADWVIDMGPGAGDEGGEIVAQGTPEDVAANPRSHTGRFLKDDAGAGSAQSSFPAPRRTRNKPSLFRRAAKLKAPR